MAANMFRIKDGILEINVTAWGCGRSGRDHVQTLRFITSWLYIYCIAGRTFVGEVGKTWTSSPLQESLHEIGRSRMLHKYTENVSIPQPEFLVLSDDLPTR